MRPGTASCSAAPGTSAGTAVSAIEFVELRLKGDSVEYLVSPMGQRAHAFTGTHDGTARLRGEQP